MGTEPEVYVFPDQRRADDNRRFTVTVVAEEHRKEDRRHDDERRGYHSNVAFASTDAVKKIGAVPDNQFLGLSWDLCARVDLVSINKTV